MKAILVGGKYNGMVCEVKELEIMPEYHGKRSPSYEFQEAHGMLCPRPELWNQPKIEGYYGPMWDGDKLRYETAAAYEGLSQ